MTRKDSTIATSTADREYAMVCQKSAEAWALAYSHDDSLLWQAQWAAERARKAWGQS